MVGESFKAYFATMGRVLKRPHDAFPQVPGAHRFGLPMRPWTFVLVGAFTLVLCLQVGPDYAGGIASAFLPVLSPMLSQPVYSSLVVGLLLFLQIAGHSVVLWALTWLIARTRFVGAVPTVSDFLRFNAYLAGTAIHLATTFIVLLRAGVTRPSDDALVATIVVVVVSAMVMTVRAYSAFLRVRWQVAFCLWLMLQFLPVPADGLRSVVEAFEISGPSMAPTLSDGSRVVVAKTRKHIAGVKRGDIVVLRSSADEVDVVKRVIGIGGDRVLVVGKEVILNGASVPSEPSAECGRKLGASVREQTVGAREELGGRTYCVGAIARGAATDAPLPVRVPDDHVFVVGDQRSHSNDSRNPHIGPVPIAQIVGVAYFKYWPTEEVELL